MSITTPNKTLNIAIAGNPNSGKTTLFNRLTGLRQKVANYPGVTVEKKIGLFSREDVAFQIIDLPGIYGLSPKSEDEKIAAEVLTGKRPDVPPIEGVLCVVDSTVLERSLYLVLQIIETGVPAALLLNMSDELRDSGGKIDLEYLSKRLGIPVYAISASKGEGLEAVDQLLIDWAQKALAHPEAKPGKRHLPKDEIEHRRALAKELVESSFKKVRLFHKLTDKIDRWVLHPFLGPIIFGAVVLLVFQSIFSWAAPVMDLIDASFVRLGSIVGGWLPDGLINSFVVDGMIAGVGSVVIFLPQILIVFFFLSILENSGYLARAAMVMDRFMGRIGLQGKSFLPLISSYACAVPGIMAARIIENKRDRMATIFIAPFMTCSARLPVYALLISAFVPDKPVIKGILGLRASTLILLYFLGFAAAVLTAWAMRSSAMKKDTMPFLLDVPPYRMPPMKSVLLMMWDRAKVFLRRAGTVILGISLILWVLVTFPQSEGPDQVKNSYAGRLGQVIEPVIQPIGFNWEIGVGLIAAQAAREVIVSSLTLIYRVDADEDNQTPLQEAMKKDLTPLGAVSLMVFFVFALQCMSTVAIVRRETGGWKIPIIMFIYMNALAYGASFLVYQGGRLLGFT